VKFVKGLIPCLILLAVLPVFAGGGVSSGEVLIPSGDGLIIMADLYVPHEDKSTPFIVLFHQAGWSRGEYKKIAPRLNRMGFNCMAIDQRSGGRVNGVENETAKRAGAEGMDVTYVDALPDLEAALIYARTHLAEGTLLGWGSSYSSSLVLKIAGDRPDLLDGVLSFSPGEYFGDLGQSATWIGESARNIEIPVFITSARQEKQEWEPIFNGIPSKDKVSFLPITAGNHGSRALWKQFDDNVAYWEAVTAFLKQFAADENQGRED